MKILRLLTAGLLLTAVLFFSVTYAKKKQDNVVPAAGAHHVIYADWKVTQDGTRTLDNVRVRDVDATGAWTEWSASRKFDKVVKDDHTDTTKPGNFIPAERGYHSAAFYRANPAFVREETIASYHCFTLRRSGKSQDNWFEMSFTPELGGTPLRVIAHSSGGESVVEALKVY